MSVEFIRLFLIRDNRMLALRLGARMCQGTFFFIDRYFYKDGPHMRSCERRPSPLRYFL